VQKITFLLRKIDKNCCHRSYTLFDYNMHQTVCRLGLCPRPGGAYRAPADSLDEMYLGGYFYREGRGGDRRRGELMGENGKKGEGKEREGREFVLCPRKK